MQVMEGQSELEGINELEQLSNLPIVRGGCGQTCSSWELTGSGHRVAAIREWLKIGTVPDNWRKKVNDRWVDEVLGQKWIAYTCPGCGKTI